MDVNGLGFVTMWRRLFGVCETPGPFGARNWSTDVNSEKGVRTGPYTHETGIATYYLYHYLYPMKMSPNMDALGKNGLGCTPLDSPSIRTIASLGTIRTGPPPRLDRSGTHAKTVSTGVITPEPERTYPKNPSPGPTESPSMAGV